MSCVSPLFLRALDLAQASPFLEQAWAEIKSECPQAGLRIRDQPKSGNNPNYAKFCSAPKDFAFDRLISWSIPNEKTIEDILSAGSLYAIPAPVDAVYKLADKRTAKHLFEKFSLLTPKWGILDREFTRGNLLNTAYHEISERELVTKIAYPLMLKPIWDCMGHGISFLRTAEELVSFLTLNTGQNFIVEHYIDGEAGSIEVIGTPDCYVFQYPCRTGTAKNSISGNFDSIRVSHPDLFHKAFNNEVKDKIARLLAALNYCGACCVDFIYSDEMLYFLEINPRVSGVSCLSAAASGINAFKETYSIAAGQWYPAIKKITRKAQAAVQPGGNNIEKYKDILLKNEEIYVYRYDIITVGTVRSRSIIFGRHKFAINKILDEIGFSVL